MDNEPNGADSTLENPENGENSETKAPEISPEELVELKKKADLATNYKIRAEKAESERKAMEARLNQPVDKKPEGSSSTNSLGVEDYIDISTSLEGLDQREKEYLAREHKLTSRPLSEIRKDENFILWQSAYRAKVEKERLAIPPNGTQPEGDKPMTLTERLSKATIAEKEKILTEAGLYRSPKKRTDRVDFNRNIVTK
ncbi:hypothetical protein GW915_00665 [bacterium]|nr:hypothetical protein [bacterium]